MSHIFDKDISLKVLIRLDMSSVFQRRGVMWA